MKLIKLLLTLSVATALGITATACSSTPPATGQGTPEQPTLLKVAASATPMTDVVRAAADSIDESYAVELVETSGYFTPNVILNDGEVAANFIQHQPHMEDFNEANGGSLVVVQPIYFVVGSFYSREYDSLVDLPKGTTFTIPQDSNEGRALELLQQEGLITLEPDVPEFEATVEDIVENPKDFSFTRVDLINLNVAYDEADVIFSLGSFARQIGLFPETDGLASEQDERFAVSLVAREDNVLSPEIQALKKAFTSDEVRQTLESLDQKVAF